MSHLSQQNIHTPQQQCWLPKLLGYNFTIEYMHGKENLAVDALSRCFQMQNSIPRCSLQSETQQLQQHGRFCLDKIQAIQSNKSSFSDFSRQQNLLWKKEKLVIPEVCQLRSQFIYEYHSTPIGGHARSLRTYKFGCLSSFIGKGCAMALKNLLRLV